MNILISLKIAYNALRVHRLRTALTILSLVIGVTSIIVIMNAGKMLKSFVLNQVQVFGTDYINIEVKVPVVSKNSTENAMGLAQGVSITTLKLKDALKIAMHPNVRGYYAGQIGQSRISYGNVSKTSLLWGVTPSFFDLHNAKIEKGRAFSEQEDKSLLKVAVLGYGLSQKLFGSENPVNKKISIGSEKFKVIGVMEEQGSIFTFDLDNVAYLPVQTLQKRILGIDHIQFIVAYMHDIKKAEATASDITEIMRAEHNIEDPKRDDFAVTTMEEAMAVLDTITKSITMLLVVIAGISLLVGGVGIMNIMYVSVSERTYEIGLRKAVGANNNNIMQQFLFEAMLLTFGAGGVGVVLGFLISYIAYLILMLNGISLGLNVAWQGIIAAVILIILTGLIFGIRPAKKASLLDPVEAIRKE